MDTIKTDIEWDKVPNLQFFVPFVYWLVIAVDIFSICSSFFLSLFIHLKLSNIIWCQINKDFNLNNDLFFLYNILRQLDCFVGSELIQTNARSYDFLSLVFTCCHVLWRSEDRQDKVLYIWPRWLHSFFFVCRLRRCTLNHWLTAIISGIDGSLLQHQTAESGTD